MIRKIILPLVLVTSANPAVAQEPLVLKFSDAAKIDYPGEVDLGTGKGQPKEDWFRESGSLQVRNVERATLTPFLPRMAANSGAAVIIAPGGGFLGLAIEEEGYRIARWLSDHGVAAFVLKYRVLATPTDPAIFRREVIAVRTGNGPASFRPPADTPPDSLADAQAALRHVAANAENYGVDPGRIGMMGFSAGAMTTMSAALANASDARPAFIAPIYGRMVQREVPQNPPPMFSAMAADDGLFAREGFGLIESWRKAGGKVEFHLYQNGGHGFGMGTAGSTTADWLEGFRRWLETNGLLAPKT